MHSSYLFRKIERRKGMRQILFAIFLLLLVSCSSGTSTDYVALVQKYNEAYEAQTKGDFPKASNGYKECINQCSMEQYADDDSVKLLLPKAMGQLMNTYQSQSDLTGCVAYFDSLKREVDDQPTEYNKVIAGQFKRDVYVFLAYSLSRTDDVQRAADLMSQALDMPLNYPTPERLFRDYAYASGVYYCVPNGEDKVLKYGRKALDELKKCQNKSGSQWLVLILGGIYHRKGQADKAIDMYQEGYELAAMAHDTLGMANAKREIADYLLQWNLYSLADKFSTQAVQLLGQTHNTNPMVETCIYVTKATILKSQNKKAMALDYLKKAQTSSTGLPYNSGVSDVNILAGSLLVSKASPCYTGDYERGMNLLEYASHEANSQKRALAFYEMAKAHISTGDFLKGEMALDSMFTVAQTAPAASVVFSEPYEFAHTYYLRQGNKTKASVYADALRKMETKSQLTSMMKNVINTVTKLELEEKEHSLDEQQDAMAKRRAVIVAVVIVLVILLSISCAGFFWQRRKAKRKVSFLKQLDVEADLLDVLRREGLDSFRIAFDKAHPMFVKFLRTKVPNLTEKDELYCRIIAIGANNIELAEFFHVARSTVVVAKYRLRKKLSLEEGQSIEDYLESQISGTRD